ncbi:MAG: hypothetical protein A2X46_16530 [Lentisphaerae bacterium GWF2_57_35]|nr:MAG: hypothetical protein A2X46_16530 [Lentisphaerae bacterium GWF2_57_35]
MGLPTQVSIVVVCYNYGRFLSAALDSALGQTQPAGEILVMDDGSTDETRAVAGRYGSRVRYVALSHQGVCPARNGGLAEAKGKWIVFLDADDALEPRYLEKTLAAWQAAPEPKPAFVYTQRADLLTGQTSSHFPEYDASLLKQRNYVMVSSLMDKEIVRSIGFDSAFAGGLEDYDLFLSMAERGYRGLLLNEPLLRVRTHPESRSRQCGRPDERWRLMSRLLSKHRSFFNAEESKVWRRKMREFVAARIRENRKPSDSMFSRVKGLLMLLRCRAPRASLREQLLFVLFPKQFEIRQTLW